MTIKQLRTTTQPYIDIDIVYGNTHITLTADDYTTMQAFGDFLIDNISIKDEETISAALILQAVKNNI